MTTFIDTLKPFAEYHGTRGQVLPALIIAQGILESGNGTSELAVNANNLFGIKKGSDWTGETYSVVSPEYTPEGVYYETLSEFRKYPSYEGCVIDLVNKYNTMARYSAVLGDMDYRSVTQKVWEAGYATDPLYPQKLQRIIEQYQLAEIIPAEEEIVMPKASDYEIAIDGGHGPNTPGKETPIVPSLGRKIQEEEFNFAVAKKLDVELRRCGFRTFFTHNEGYDVPLTTRTNKANAEKADALVSIHFNAMGNTFAYSTAEGFSCHIQEGMSNTSGAYKLAKIMCEELARGTKQVNRGIVKQNLAMTRQTNMTAVLVECGFMDDPEEALLMLNPKFQQEVAAELAKAFCRYYGVPYVSAGGPTVPAPTSKYYRVRKSWADAGSQKGSFADLVNARELANELADQDYNVYDWNGKLVYDPKPEAEVEKWYRVRKTWADVDSQKGAFQDPNEARVLADQLQKDGYEVYGPDGKVYYTPPAVVKVSKPAPPKEEDDMLEGLIVLHGKDDFVAAEKVAHKTGFPMAMKQGNLKAKHIIKVGGSKTGLKADKITLLSGSSWQATVAEVDKFLK